MKNLRWTFAAAMLLLCGGADGFALDSGAAAMDGSSFIVDAWPSGPGEQKLPQSSVIAIRQTHDGYLWLGTLGGLVRFDGARFTVFDKANTPGLADNRVVNLFEDKSGRLWIGTHAGDVLFISGDGQIHPLDLGGAGKSEPLRSICEDGNGAIWMNMPDGRVLRFWNNQVEELNFSASAMIADAKGAVWLGAELRDRENNLITSIISVTNSSTVASRLEMSLSKIDLLLAGRDGGFWVLANGRVQKWNEAGVERDFGGFPWDNLRSPVTCGCEDNEGHLIVGTHGAGIFWFDAQGHAAHISTAQRLSPDAHGVVLSLAMDREGNLWAGTDGGGLNRVKRRMFGVAADSTSWTLQSVCEADPGELWLGTFNDGLKFFKDGAVQKLNVEPAVFTNLSVRTVFVGREKQVLVGTVAAPYGLFQVALQGTNEIFFPARELGAVSAIYQDSAGLLWFGTQNGLVSWNGKDWNRYTTHEGLSSDAVRAIAGDARGNLWIGTEGGLNLMRDGQFSPVPAGHPATETITALLVDTNGVLWIGTDGEGLACLNQGQWEKFSKHDGLSSDSIGYLIEDGLGYLWIGSYTGLMRVRLKDLGDFAAHTIDFIPCRVFGESDGLPTSECTQGSQPAACLSRDGTLWFPTAKGLVSVQPGQLPANTNRPPVIIESVLVESQEQKTNSFGAPLQTVVVPPRKEGIDIRYTSLNFSAPDNVRFKYKLAGHEAHWADAGNRRVASYSKLPPGEYLFRVIAFNQDGVPNLNGATLKVIVLPAFWQKLSFKIAAALVLALITGGLIYYFSTQKLQRELAVFKQQEALQRERTRIARDLHDQLGANITQVSLLGELAQADKDMPEEVESHARQICQTARETTHALDEIVWAVNPSNDTLEGLVNYACKYAQDYLELAGVSHRFDLPPELPAATIAPDARHNVFLAFKESINNVVKHAQAKSTWVRLQLAGNQFTLQIEDDGRGLENPEGRPGRNGLRNMRKRMEDIGGSFYIGPAAGRGTIVRLTAPMSRR